MGPKYSGNHLLIFQWGGVLQFTKFGYLRIFINMPQQAGQLTIPMHIVAYSHRQEPFEDLLEDVLEDVFGLAPNAPH